jgi:hypothetical protein
LLKETGPARPGLFFSSFSFANDRLRDFASPQHPERSLPSGVGKGVPMAPYLCGYSARKAADDYFTPRIANRLNLPAFFRNFTEFTNELLCI